MWWKMTEDHNNIINTENSCIEHKSTGTYIYSQDIDSKMK